MFSGYSRLPQSSVIVVVVLALALAFITGCSSDEDKVARFVARGEEYVENDQPEEAIIEFKNVLQIDPENVVAHEALSLAFLKVEKPREAYWEMSETVRLDPSNVDARLRYGTVSAAIGDFGLTLEQAEAVLQLDPANPAGFILRGQSHEADEEFEKAESDFEKAVESEPDAAAYRFLLSGFYERRGHPEQAEAALRDLIEVEESYMAVATLSRLVVRARDREEESERLLERAVELAKAAPVEVPKNRESGEYSKTSLIPNVAREKAVQASYLLLAAFHFDHDRFDRSIEVLEEGVAESETKSELIYQMAAFHRVKGMTEEENALIRRATTESPDSVAAQLILSAYLGRQGDVEGALDAARSAVAIEPNNRSAQLREAELLVDAGFRDGDSSGIDAGFAIVESILEEEPDSPEAHFVLAKVELSRSNPDAAKESLETVLHARPDWAQARFVLGSVLAAKGDLSRARVELARAVELDPRLLPARKLLVKLHSRLGEHEFVIESGREYLQLQPNDIEVRIIVGQSLIRIGRGEDAYAEVEKIPEDQRDAAALFALGRLDLAFGRTELGAERLQRADELAPGNPQVLRTLLSLDRARGTLEASAIRIAKAVETTPDQSEVVELDGELKILMGEVEPARTAFERAVELDPRNISAQLSLANLEARTGNVEGMIAVIERAAEASPESSDLQYRLAAMYEQNGRRPDAINAYEKSISLNGDLAVAKNNLAYLLTDSGGNLDRALELAQQAKEQLPDDANSADTLGWVLLKRGVPSAAIGYLEEAAERFPADATEIQGVVRNHLAEAYEKNSEPAKAIGASRTVLENWEKLSKLAVERGVDFEEPDWAKDARARIQRLESAS